MPSKRRRKKQAKKTPVGGKFKTGFSAGGKTDKIYSRAFK